MQPSASHVEDQVFDDSDGPKHLFTVRNIALAGTVIILTAGGLGYYYRQELFGIGVVPANTSTVTSHEYKLNLGKDKLVNVVKDNQNSYVPAFVKNLWRNSKSANVFAFKTKDAAGKETEVKVKSVEELFKKFAGLAGTETYVSGIDESLFAKADDKFILPIKTSGKTELEEFATFQELLEKIKELGKGDVKDKVIDYEALAVLREFMEEELEKEYPHRLLFNLPSEVEFSIDGHKINPVGDYLTPGRKVYLMRFKNAEDYGKARAEISSKYFKGDGTGVDFHGIQKQVKMAGDKYLLPLKCGEQGIKKVPLDGQTLANILGSKKLPEEYKDCEISYGDIYV